MLVSFSLDPLLTFIKSKSNFSSSNSYFISSKQAQANNNNNSWIYKALFPEDTQRWLSLPQI